MKRLAMWLLASAAVGSACGKSSTPSSPSPPPVTAPAPTISTLTFQIPAAPGNPADSFTRTPATGAMFGASVRTTCVPNPNLAGSFCPDLQVYVTNGPNDSRSCQMIVTAPTGRTLGVGSYPNASSTATGGSAGFIFNCAYGGTTCNESVAAFTVQELQSTPAGVVTRLHMTFEQTCLGGFPPTVGFFGKGTGELWIIDGTARYPFP